MVEIVGQRDRTGQSAGWRHPLAGGPPGNQPGDRHAGAGDHQVVAGLQVVEQARQLALGLVHIHLLGAGRL
ncbi:hypothetical protein AAJV73_15980 [Cyanobium sp. BSA11S]|uniref:hypothetical protein n=1 Tax=Cyanobium sp. BSA11S TaxID=3108224 RepID=UPI003D8157BB